MKLTSRIAIFYILILLIVILVFINVISDTVSWAKQHYISSQGYTEANTSSVINTINTQGYQNITPEILNSFANMEKARTAMTEQYKKQNLRLFVGDIIMIIIFLGLTLVLVNIIIFTRVTLDNSIIKIYYPWGALKAFLGKPVILNIRDIRTLKIVRTTPAGPDLTDFRNMNWRDALILNDIALPGYIYTGLGAIYAEISKQRPDLKTEYHKNTVGENMQNYH